MPLAMVVVALYVVVTAPLLYLVLRVHSLQSDYTRLFMAALILQIIPIGLVFFPLGFIGVVLLLASLVATWRRNRRFRAMGIDNPEVAKRWGLELVFNLWALGFALEQKGVAYLFLDVVGRHGLGFLWSFLIPASALGWLVLIGLIIRERRML
jgi:hypothetical protein